MRCLRLRVPFLWVDSRSSSARVVAVLALSASLAASSAQGAWLFSDDFDSVSGSVATGVGDGTAAAVGTLGNWNVNKPQNSGASATVSAVDGSLMYVGNNYSVGSAGGKKIQITTHTSTSSNSAIFDRTFATQNGEIWLSFTFQVNKDDFDQTLAPMMFFSNQQFANIGTQGYFGYGLNGSDPGISRLSLRRGTSAMQLSTVPSAADTTFYVVARMWKDADTTYNKTEMWINPILGGDESLPAPTLAHTETWNPANSAMQGTDTSYVGLRYFGAFNDGRAVFLDNFRGGLSWNDIRPGAVPEPGTATLVGMSIMGLLFLRRKVV